MADHDLIALAEQHGAEVETNASTGLTWVEFRLDEFEAFAAALSAQPKEANRIGPHPDAIDLAPGLVRMEATHDAWEGGRVMAQLEAAQTQEACNVDLVSSRMCERGTKGCAIEHAAQPPRLSRTRLFDPLSRTRQMLLQGSRKQKLTSVTASCATWHCLC